MNNILYRIPQLSSSKDPEYNKLFRDIKTFRARENAKTKKSLNFKTKAVHCIVT